MTSPIPYDEPIKVIAAIIQSELGLDDGSIMLAYEKWKIPEDTGLYMVLSYLSQKQIGNNNYTVPTDTGLTEVQTVTQLSVIQIDLMSYDKSARMRKWEIATALASIFSQQMQELNNLNIARMPREFLDASMLEETKMLNRFTTTIGVTTLFTKTKGAPYFDQFPTPEVFTNV